MVTPGSTPPVSSFTLPAICAVDPAWAPASEGMKSSRRARKKRARRVRFIVADLSEFRMPSIPLDHLNRNPSSAESTNSSRTLSAMTRRFVRDVALLVVVELVDLAEILGRVGVAEAALFAALRLRGRARRILIGIERESPHQLSL